MAQGFSLLRGLKEQFGDPIVLEIDTSLSSGLIFGFNFTTGLSGETSATGSAAYQTLVTWGDGTYNYYTTNTGQTATKTYSVGGVYQVKIYGRVRGLTAHSTVAYANKLKRILSWGKAVALTALAIGNNSKLIEVPNYLPPSVKTLQNMFWNCATINDPNIASWNTSNVTNMQAMFSGATVFNQPIGSWNVSKVTNMSQMFQAANGFNQNIGGWTFGAGTSLAGMFQNNTGTLANTGITSWNTANVTNMSNMFNGATNFNQSLNSWNVSGCTNFTGMFQGANSFNSNIGSWTFGAGASLNSMFRNNTGTLANTGITSWDTANVTNMSYMFSNATNFNQNISVWNFQNVTDFSYMFANTANSFSGCGIPNFSFSTSLSKTISLSGMFSGNSGFNSDISGWNLSRVNNFSSMFASTANSFSGCNIQNWTLSTSADISINMNSMFESNTGFNSPIGNWNTIRLTTSAFMFKNSIFNQPVGNWNVSNVTSCNEFFARNAVFNQDIGSWDLSSSTSLSGMFYNCFAFNNGGSSNINNLKIRTVSGTNTEVMFFGCTSFNQPIGNWNMSGAYSLLNMFNGATAFNQDISTWNVSNITNMSGTFTNATAFNQSLGSWALNNSVTLPDLSTCGMDSSNYSKTLIGWANYVSSTGTAKSRSLTATGKSVSSDTFSGSPYNTGVSARTYLLTALSSGAGWTILDSVPEVAQIPVNSTGFLVSYPSAKGAYSLRNLYSTYTDGVIRVRRSSDSAEADFTSAEITDGTLTTWVGAGNDGFVKTWYDQSTFRNHMTQATTTKQPKIVTSGVLITDGNRPAVEFASDGTNWLQTSSGTISGVRSVFMTASSSYTGSSYMFFLGDSGSTYTYHGGQTSIFDIGWVHADIKNGTNKLNNVVSSFTANASGRPFNRVIISMIHTSPAGIFNSIAQDRVNDGRNWRGKVQELVVYGTDQTSNSDNIHSDVNTYYSIY